MSNITKQNQFNYKRRTLWNGSHLAGITLILMSLIIWIASYFVTDETDPLTLYTAIAILFLIGILSVSTYSGTLVNFRSNRFKEYQSVFWYKFGNWQEFPKIEHVEIIHHSFRKSNIPNGVSPTFSHEVTIYKCVLVTGERKVIAFDFPKEKQAVNAMQEIKRGLGLL